MRKLAFILILVLSISLITFKAFTGDWVPNEPPGPTMHSLNEIYDQIVQNAVPRYEYKYFDYIASGETVTVHNGSGVVHSIILGGYYRFRLRIMDGNDIICEIKDSSYDAKAIPLDISYKNSLTLDSTSVDRQHHITVVYKPDN